MRPQGTFLPRLGVLAAIVFWGVSFVATKRAVAEISPAALVFARAGLGSLLLLSILLLRRRGSPLVPPRETWRPLILMGFVGVAFHQMLQAYGLSLTSAVNAGWLIGLTPIWSAVLAAWTLRERFGPGKVIGLALGFLGAVLVVSRGRLDSNTLALPAARGDFLILASTVNWAFYTVLGHGVLRRIGPVRATAGAMISGTLLLAPLWFLEGAWRDYPRLSLGGWGALLFLGVACSGLGYLFWYGALERIEASRVASFLYLEPLVTLGAAVLMLGERVGAVTFLGGALLFTGVFLVQRAAGLGTPLETGAPGERARPATSGASGLVVGEPTYPAPPAETAGNFH